MHLVCGNENRKGKRIKRGPSPLASRPRAEYDTDGKRRIVQPPFSTGLQTPSGSHVYRAVHVTSTRFGVFLWDACEQSSSPARDCFTGAHTILGVSMEPLTPHDFYFAGPEDTIRYTSGTFIVGGTG